MALENPNFAGGSRGYPMDATPIWGVTASLISSTTVVTIIANATAGRRLYITQIVVTNITDAELPTIVIADNNASPNNIIYLEPGGSVATGGPSSTIIWTPRDPVKLRNAGEGITGAATASFGDCHVFAQGFTIDE
jgi:hypothetical protein